MRPQCAILLQLGAMGHACSIPVPLRLTDDIGLVLGISLHLPVVLDVLLAVPPIGLLADLLPALPVDALHISDGGSARSEKQNFQFSCWQLSHHTLLSPHFPLCFTQTPISAFGFCLEDASP